MCLSTVYLESKGPQNLLMEEAASIAIEQDTITITTLFGDRKDLSGFSLSEVNLLEHYIIVKRHGGAHG
ncbi:MAG: CooT family nickel-binding protein [Chitinivibrionales bacterium]|nr:CooT family nickel-binding protein [Chitinivibrionales bacterium]